MERKDLLSTEQMTNLETPQFQTDDSTTVVRFTPWRDPRYLFGLACIALSFILFWASTSKSDNIFAQKDSIWVCHAITIIFWAVMTFSKKAKTHWFETKIDYTLQLMVLSQIGAFALNALLIDVFPPSVLWLQVALTVHCLALLTFSLRDWLPTQVLYALFFIVGMGFVLDIYFLILTLPFTAIGIAAIWFFGITLYACAPLLKVIYEIVFLVKTNAFNPIFKRFFFGGVFATVLALGLFCAAWSHLVHKTQNALGDTQNPLPAWIRIAQILPPSVLTEKLLKSEVATIDNSLFINFSRLGERTHDPLMIVANWLKPIPRMDDADRAHALRAIFDARTQAEERLWSGNNLRIEKVKTSVEFHPAHRLAYTEKVINLKNLDLNQTRWATEEAIFTFRLPEGGVVTSSSLWVDDEEREAFLTTRGKADSAYRSVVGVERRDPSVVHWQEGNAVTVRIFPCSPNMPRQFKLGFTTPLRYQNSQLWYDNITFDGVIADDATDSLRLSFAENPQTITSDLHFDKNLSTNCAATDTWSVSMPTPTLSNEVFSFDKKQYRVQEMTPQYEAFHPKEIYLDINAAWTKQDFKNIIKLMPSDAASDELLFFMDGKKTRFRNDEALFDDLSTKNFSVFPIHLIENPDNALIITKNKPFSPDFTALKGSRFADDMAKVLPNAAPVRVFYLDNQPSTYWHTLQQMRVVHAVGGSLSDLTSLLRDKKFLKQTETLTKLNIPTANMSIEEIPINSPNSSISKQNDHLLRLFAYNKILATVGKNYFSKDYDLKPLIDLAEKGYVVSPVSSLIVLETDEDYKRFGIKKGEKKSLGNAILKQATANKSGAAPEPHEWLLIGLALGLVIFFIRKQPA
ncbi:MAG: XrtN system VIT domain-containing protein [Saprospiraceae bacterium]|nr:XrtN system VIT domain-containing protein [Saprospiraceae bacterium]